MNFVRNTFFLILATGASVLASLLTNLVLARFLSVPDRGLYAVATSLVVISMMLTQVAWPTSVVYRIRRVRVPPGGVLSASLIATLTSTLIILGSTALLGPAIRDRLLGGANPIVLWVALASVPFHMIGRVLVSIARAIDRFDIGNWDQLLRSWGTLIGLVGVLVVYRGGLVHALGVILLLHSLVSLITFIRVTWLVGLEMRPQLAEIRETLRYGSKTYAQTIAAQVHERADIFLLAYLLDRPEAVAVYAVAAGVTTRLKVLPQALAASLFPALSGSSVENMASITARTMRHTVLWVGVMTVALAIAAPRLIPLLFGEQYRSAIPAFLLLLPASAVFVIYTVLNRYFMAQGRQRINVVTQLSAAVVNIALNLMWIPQYGVLGAAASSLVSYSLQAVAISAAFLRDGKATIAETFMVRRSDFAVYARRVPGTARWLRGE